MPSAASGDATARFDQHVGDDDDAVADHHDAGADRRDQALRHVGDHAYATSWSLSSFDPSSSVRVTSMALRYVGQVVDEVGEADQHDDRGHREHQHVGRQADDERHGRAHAAAASSRSWSGARSRLHEQRERDQHDEGTTPGACRSGRRPLPRRRSGRGPLRAGGPRHHASIAAWVTVRAWARDGPPLPSPPGYDHAMLHAGLAVRCVPWKGSAASARPAGAVRGSSPTDVRMTCVAGRSS